MKIKNNYYCLVDSNNKPDFRFIFTSEHAAEKKRHQIKNSIVGETLFVSKHKRDFFIDGIKKEFISPIKPVKIKNGCWTTLKTTKVSLLDTIKPTSYFTEVIKESQKVEVTQDSIITSFKKILPEEKSITNPENTTTGHSPLPKIIPTSKKQFSSTYFNETPLTNNKKNVSLFKTKLFTANFAVVLLFCLITVFYTNNSSSKKISTALLEKQRKLITEQTANSDEIAVLGSMHKKDTAIENSMSKEDDIDNMVFNTLMEFEKIRSDQLEESIKKMVAGTPMEKMAPYIAKKDKIVAAFLVGISKKESNYGRRVPVLNGEDCFNYWGYRGIRKRMGSGGHTCFDSPEDAIETVGGRIERLVESGVDTPEEMVLWKCGSDCNATGGWPAARKWIQDVNMYYTKMLNTANDDEKSSEKIRMLNETIES